MPDGVMKLKELRSVWKVLIETEHELVPVERTEWKSLREFCSYEGNSRSKQRNAMLLVHSAH